MIHRQSHAGAWQRCAVLCSDRDDDLALVDRRDLFSVFFSFWLFLLLSLGFGTSIHEWKFDGVVLGHGDRRLGSRCETSAVCVCVTVYSPAGRSGTLS